MKKVLFMCVENSCRSQMAEGFARFFGNDVLEAYSAGSAPAAAVNADAVKVMYELGIDISKNTTKSFEQLPIKEFDCVVTMGCKDTCPFINAGKHINWQIQDPKGKSLDLFRQVRDEIRGKIRNLIQQVRQDSQA